MVQTVKIRGQHLQQNLPASVPADNANMSGATAVNSPAAVSWPAETTPKGLIVSQVWWSYTGGTPTGNLSITDGVTTIAFDIGVSGPNNMTFQPPLMFGSSKAVTLTLGAGGAAVTGKVGANVYYLQ